MARAQRAIGWVWERRRWVVALGCAALGPWLAAALALDAHGRAEIAEGERWDAIVVPGCKVDPDGQPSLALQRRTRQAVRLWRRHRAPTIVLTGGLGQNPPTEARAAADLAMELGVPGDALVLEERSTSTEENARLAAEQIGRRRVLVVTDSYHVFRARRVFGRYFNDVEAFGSTPRPWVRLTGSLREVLAVVYYHLSGRL